MSFEINIENIKQICKQYVGDKARVFVNYKELDVKGHPVYVRLNRDTDSLTVTADQRISSQQLENLKQKDETKFLELKSSLNADNTKSNLIANDFEKFSNSVSGSLQLYRVAASIGEISEDYLDEGQKALLKGVYSIGVIPEFFGLNIITMDFALSEQILDNNLTGKAVTLQYGEKHLTVQEPQVGKLSTGLGAAMEYYNAQINMDLSLKFLGRGTRTTPEFERVKLLDDYVPIFVKFAGLKNRLYETYGLIEGFTLTAKSIKVENRNVNGGNMKSMQVDAEDSFTVYCPKSNFVNSLGIYPKKYDYKFFMYIVYGLLLGKYFPSMNEHRYIINESGQVLSEYQFKASGINEGFTRIPTLVSFIETTLSDNKDKNFIEKISYLLEAKTVEDLFKPVEENKYL